MKNVTIVVGIGICFLAGLLCTQSGFAQGGGFITPLTNDVAAQETALPSGAVHQGSQVLHVVSAKENLHLLAAYYYGDPRQWQRIYRQNRSILRNPNVLTIGQTLQIPVDETWKPVFSYQEWFRLATRNGEWVPGQRWQRASRTAYRPPPSSDKAQSVTGTTSSAPQEVPQIKVPQEIIDVIVEEAPSAEEMPTDDTPERQSPVDVEMQSPAF